MELLEEPEMRVLLFILFYVLTLLNLRLHDNKMWEKCEKTSLALKKRFHVAQHFQNDPDVHISPKTVYFV